MLTIAALSGRALAQAAVRAGFTAAVADLFGDRETRAAASAYRMAHGDLISGFDSDSLRRALEQFNPGWPLIYGGGLEAQPDLLRRIALDRPILGNQPDTVEQVTRPETFFPALARLNLPAPQITRTPPVNGADWLCKRTGSSGGLAVTPCPPNPSAYPDSPGIYYQRHLPGTPYSVQFISNGDHAEVLCFCRNHLAPTQGRPYRFGGISTGHNLSDCLRARLADATERLGEHFALRGLNSLDVIIKDDDFTILEINPRPGAALDLLEDAAPGWSIPAHIAACRNQSWPAWPATHWPGIQQREIYLTVFYTDDELIIPAEADWPSYCFDTPQGGDTIKPRMPVCSIRAEAGGDLPASQLSLMRHKALRQRLDRYKKRSAPARMIAPEADA